MNYTKGPWNAEEIAPHEWAVMQSLTMVCYHSQSEGNARLIAAAVNGCQAVNPGNPIATAMAIKEMYEALKELVKIVSDYVKQYDRAVAVLARAERGE